jgi:hypothetical protein
MQAMLEVKCVQRRNALVDREPGTGFTDIESQIGTKELAIGQLRHPSKILGIPEFWCSFNRHAFNCADNFNGVPCSCVFEYAFVISDDDPHSTLHEGLLYELLRNCLSEAYINL